MALLKCIALFLFFLLTEKESPNIYMKYLWLAKIRKQMRKISQFGDCGKIVFVADSKNRC